MPFPPLHYLPAVLSHTVCAGLLAGALLIVLSAQAAEPDELASTLRLLDQMQASLVRARAVAAQADPAERGRFYFDYLRASADLNTVHAGIEHYLTPSRAQPRYSGAVTGRYRRGCP